MKKFFLFILGFIVIVFIFVIIITKDVREKNEQEKLTQAKEVRESVELLIKNGTKEGVFVKIDTKNHLVYVNANKWYKKTQGYREIFVEMIAKNFGILETGKIPDIPRSYIIDNKTGKESGSYGPKKR